MEQKHIDSLAVFIKNNLKTLTALKDVEIIEGKNKLLIVNVFVDYDNYVIDVLSGDDIANIVTQNIANKIVDAGSEGLSIDFPAGKIDILYKLKDINEKEKEDDKIGQR